MSKERSKDKGGTLNGQSKSANNNRGVSGKVQESDNTTNRDRKDTGHIER